MTLPLPALGTIERPVLAVILVERCLARWGGDMADDWDRRWVGGCKETTRQNLLAQGPRCPGLLYHGGGVVDTKRSFSADQHPWGDEHFGSDRLADTCA